MTPTPNTETPLQSWKEIGAYLQRDATTARRWEKEENLPVHRHTHKARASVYAYPSEIDDWRESRKALPEPQAPMPLWKMLIAPPRRMALGVTMGLCLVMVGNGLRPQPVEAQGALSVKQIELGDEADYFSVSPDGRFAAYDSWQFPANGDLVVRDLRGKGKVRLVTSHCGREDKGCAYSEAPQISPDAKKVAYTWYDETAVEGQLRVIQNSAGAKPKVLVGGGDISMVRAHGWSPDGKTVLVLMHLNDKTQQIGTVSAEDGKLTVLKKVRVAQDLKLGDPSFSADGRYVAYSAPLEGRPAVRRIYTLKADGSGETELTRDDAVSDSPVWTPDGGSILFTSNQLGHTDLWGIPVRDGKAVGGQKIVKRDMDGAYLHSVTKNGSVIYSSRRFEYAITLADIEPGSRLPRVRARINGHAPRWSPDGKLLAFGRPRSAPGSPTDLVVLSLDGEERKYPHTGTGSSTIVAWFNDGKSVLQRVTAADRTSAFYRVDLTSGVFTKLLTQEPEDQQKPWFLSPDEKALYFGEGGKNLERLVAINFASGERKSIATFSSLLNYAVTVSPDRTKLGIITEPGAPKDRVFGVVDLPEGTYRELYRAPTNNFIARRQVMWTADSKALLFPKTDQRTKDDGTLAVMQVPVAGGPVVSAGWRIEDGLPVEIFPRPGSPTSVALAKQEGIGEFWALDNVMGVLAKVTR